MSGPGITIVRVAQSVTDMYHRTLKERLRESEESLPSKLRDRPDQWVLERTVAENFFQLTKHVDFVYNDFLLERTLVKRLRVPPAELVIVSRSLLSSMLILTGNRHRQGWYSNDLPWLASPNSMILVSPEGSCCVDRIICTSTGRSSCARTSASLAQQVTDDS